MCKVTQDFILGYLQPSLRDYFRVTGLYRVTNFIES